MREDRTTPQILDRITDQRDARAPLTRTRGQRGSEIALLGILMVTSTIGLEDRLPVLSLGIHLQVPDILLVGSLGCIAVRWLVVPEFRIVRTPLDWPLLIFYVVTLFSTLVGIIQSSVDVDLAIQGVRVFSYYLTFFVVTNLITARRQLTFLLNGIFLLATIVAVAIIAQGMMFGVGTQTVPPGFSIVVVSFVTTLCVLVSERFTTRGLLRFLQCGLLGVGCLMAFRRSYWAVLIVALFLAASLVRGADKRRLIGWGVVVMAPAMLVLLVVFNAPELPLSRWLQASLDRLSTVNVGAFTGEDENYNYRRLENGYALSAIRSSPVIGLGMGVRYRPLDPRLDEYDLLTGGLKEGKTSFIHNSHLGILLQSGLLGYLSLTGLSLAFLVRGFRNWRKIPNTRMRAVVLGFTLVYLAVLIAAGANSIFMQWSWVPVLGIIMGINEVILQQSRAG
jgi:O-antigen ligase